MSRPQYAGNGENGMPDKNTIEIKDGKIRVKSAECPDKTCVHMGWLSSSAMPIVCLPNHLVIRFAASDNDVDAVAN